MAGIVAAAVVAMTASAPVAISITAVIAAIVVAIGSAIRRQEAAEFRLLAGTLQAISGGDLTGQLPATNSETAAAMAEAIAELTDRLRTLLTENHNVVEVLSKQWQEMNEVAWAMSSTSETTVKDVRAAAASAAEVSERIMIIASGAEETATTIKDVADHASQASSVAAYGTRQASAASRTFEELRTASKQVESVVKLILSIASQTHLLALNATIEAARAGEHGRGFAVVATEVKQLAEATAHATDDVIATMQDIDGGSQRASTAITEITTTIDQVNASQSAIAAAVVQQTAVTESIGDSSAAAAYRATELAANVKALTDAVRITAYAGAQARTVAAEVAGAEHALKAVLEGFRFVPAETAAAASSEEAERKRLEQGTLTVDGVTTVQNYVTGAGLHQFNYEGRWGHAAANVEADGTNSHSSMPGDTAMMRFIGTRIKFFGVNAPNHGMATISVDGGPETVIDQYAEARVHGLLNWESPSLPRGEHTFNLTVLGESNARSRYVWVNVDRVEILG
ncbi:MAG: methyl-accepting chemotaxis protein [Acidothermaceae bacterium]